MRRIAPLLLSALLAALTSCGSPAVGDGCCPPAPCPGEDFYTHVNQPWLESHPIPAAYGSYGVFHEINDRNQELLREILEQAGESHMATDASELSRKLGRFWASAMDSEANEAAGTQGLAPYLAQIDGIASAEDFARVVAHLHLVNADVLFGLGAEADFSDSTRKITFLVPGGFGLPEKDYYFLEDEESVTLRQQYVTHIGNMLRLLGDVDADASAEAAWAIELLMAEQSLNAVQYRDPSVLANRILSSEMAGEIIPDFDWGTYFAALGVDQQEYVNLVAPSYFQHLNSLLSGFPMEDWKAYLRWHLVSSCAPYMTADLVAEDFDFFSRKLRGTPENRDLWERALRSVNGSMGEALGQAFVARAFTPEAKDLALEMVADLLEAYRIDIQQLEWMTDTTKEKALEKLAAFTVKIGYPDKWRDWSGLHVIGDTWLENVLEARVFNNRHELAKIGKAVDPTEWGMSPQTVNAYYNPLANEIVFPAAILQPPFFGLEQSLADNYGAMGAIIGHEITHGFDDMGSQFDAQGNMVNWWTEEDRAEFEKRAQVLVDQFDAYVAIDDLHVNGELTLGENIADLGGLKMAHMAFRLRSERNGVVESADGFSGDQLFFRSWARAWRQNSRDEALKLQVNTDPHSPEKFRANGPLGNLPTFAEAFGLSEDSPMVREASARADIW